MRIIAIANQKGGTGKTTVAINLSASLAREGKRTLLMDLDPQGQCALGLAVPEHQIELSVADALKADPAAEPFDLKRIIWQISAQFDLAPSRTDLAEFEDDQPNSEEAEKRLAALLETVSESYDFAILDCPPHIGRLTRSALRAAGEVIIPVDTGYFSLHGLTKQLASIDKIDARLKRRHRVTVLANLYDVRTKLAREILAEMRRKFDSRLFKTFINVNTKLREGASYGQPITEYDPASMGSRDFANLAHELIAQESAPESERPLVEMETAARESALVAARIPNGPSADLIRQADALAENAARLLATSETLIGREKQTAPRVERLTHEVTRQKIEEIYGPQCREDGVIFTACIPGARAVQLAGDFNGWNPGVTPMMANGRRDVFQTKLKLHPGRYRYRLVIDGRWVNDPHNPAVESNPYGDLNSVLEVH